MFSSWCSGDDEILKKAATYSNEGLRVLLLGSCQKLYKDAKEIEEFTPLSLIVLSDCVKEDALDTFAFFAKQGVAVKVISGDDPVTVSYIARLAGIPGVDAYIDAGTLPDDIDELCKIAPKYSVFGRVTPEKLSVWWATALTMFSHSKMLTVELPWQTERTLQNNVHTLY